MTLPKQIKTALADEALDAFWQVIGRRFPRARTGDLSWDCYFALQSSAEQAIGQWVENNVPGAANLCGTQGDDPVS